MVPSRLHSKSRCPHYAVVSEEELSRARPSPSPACSTRPSLAVTVPLGTAIIGSDFQLGATLGTPLGKGAKDLVDIVRSTKSGK